MHFRVMNNSNAIKLKEALNVFSLKDEKGLFKPFNMLYRTFNSTTKKGGRLINYQGVKYLPSVKSESKKDPNHFINRTRNIELPNGEIKSVIIDFIISINNKPVIF